MSEKVFYLPKATAVTATGVGSAAWFASFFISDFYTPSGRFGDRFFASHSFFCPTTKAKRRPQDAPIATKAAPPPFAAGA